MQNKMCVFRRMMFLLIPDGAIKILSLFAEISVAGIDGSVLRL